jgi:6-phosphogluconolactonase (cycloisomerase 2 family)
MQPPASPPRFAYVGCYTTAQRQGRGEGINVYRIDASTGGFTHVQLVKDLVNPSWLGLDRRRRALYSAHGDGQVVSVFRVDGESGALSAIGTQPTGGTNGVRLGTDPDDRFLVVANYSTGTVAVLPINPDGSLAPVADLAALHGRPGPHPTEQTRSHPHDIVFAPRGGFIVVPDKGLDAVFVFRLDPARGTLVAADPPSVATRPGAGPRHADVHPSRPFVYVLNELDSTLTTYGLDERRGALTPLQVITTLPPGFAGRNTTSEIAVAPSGRFVYASNRGHDSLAIFAVDGGTGLLRPVGWEPTQGRTPRFFAIEPSGTFLYVANQDSDTIIAFRIDGDALTPTGHVVNTGSPSSIVFR